MSINEDIKLEKGKEKRKTGGAVGLYKYLARAAKALVVTETTVENSTIQYGTVPDSINSMCRNKQRRLKFYAVFGSRELT